MRPRSRVASSRSRTVVVVETRPGRMASDRSGIIGAVSRVVAVEFRFAELCLIKSGRIKPSPTEPGLTELRCVEFIGRDHAKVRLEPVQRAHRLAFLCRPSTCADHRRTDRRTRLAMARRPPDMVNARLAVYRPVTRFRHAHTSSRA